MSIINRICATVVNMILYLYLWVYFYFLCNVCVRVFFSFSFFTTWPACWAYACSGSLPCVQLYCIILLFMLWWIKFSLCLVKTFITCLT